jgi:hypothetical protein
VLGREQVEARVAVVGAGWKDRGADQAPDAQIHSVAD